MTWYPRLILSPLCRLLREGSAVLLLTGAPAHGATPTTEAEAGDLSVSFGALYSNTTLTGGVLTRSRLGPLLDLDYKRGHFYASTVRGVGFNVLQTKVFTVGVGAAVQLGRRQSQDPRYQGLGNVSPSPLVILTADWNPLEDFIHIYGTASPATRRQNGTFYTVGTTLGFPLVGPLNGFIDASWVWANNSYVSTYFGVTPQQASASGYTPFQPRSGWISRSLSLGLQCDLSQRWSIWASFGASRVEGDAARSPITDRRGLPAHSVFVTCKF